MPNPLLDLYNKAEAIKGKKLIITLSVIFVLFTVIGVGAGYYINKKLTKDETDAAYLAKLQSVQRPEKYYEGRVVYVNPAYYPEDNISYALEDSSGEEAFLLASKDQKLSIAEGLNVRLTGILKKTKDGSKDVLEVDKLIIKNATN